MTVPPSGHQVELALGDQRAVVVEVGGGLRSYDVAGRAVLDGYPEHEPATGGRGQVLLPWPNRVRDGRWRWAGADLQLPLSEVAGHNAIHGLVRWTPWRLVDRSAASATWEVVLHPQPGWPGVLRCTSAYTLSGDGLAVTLAAENVGGQDCPLAVGMHPYLAAVGLVDDGELVLPAARYAPVDVRGLPEAVRDVQGTAHDFRAGRRVGPAALDLPFTGLDRDAAGRATATWRDAGREVELWVDGSFGWLHLYTGDTVPQPERRRRGLALEPMTAPAGALTSGEGLVVLAPGQRWTGTWGLRVRPGLPGSTAPAS